MPAPAIFSQAELDRVIAETLPPSLPDGHRNAIVGTVDQTGARVVAGFTMGSSNQWQLQGAFKHDWAGGNEVGGRVLLSW